MLHGGNIKNNVLLAGIRWGILVPLFALSHTTLHSIRREAGFSGNAVQNALSFPKDKKNTKYVSRYEFFGS